MATDESAAERAAHARVGVLKWGMPLQCNIDSRGRAARLIYGLVLIAAGVAMLLLWAIPRGTATSWVVTAAAILGGAFAIFEARAGWCVVRAMGFKTPL